MNKLEEAQKAGFNSAFTVLFKDGKRKDWKKL